MACVRQSNHTRQSVSTGAPEIGAAKCAMPSNWVSNGRPRLEKCRASGSWAAVRMETAQAPAASTAAWKRLLRLTHTRTIGGSNETEDTAVAVMACARPPVRAVTTVTPLEKCPMACRRASAEAGTPSATASVVTGSNRRSPFASSLAHPRLR